MSTAPATASFDLTGPLPTGVTVLEASAGTGKTYTIAALAARYVAEGTPLEELLLITFTRMATGELRERVRERLAATERALGRVLAGGTPEGEDAVVALLAIGEREAVATRHRRLAGALAGFDAATIATIHGFCQEVLGGLGVEGDVERDGGFAEDVAELADEVVDDLYVRKFHRHGMAQFTRAQARTIAKAAIENPAARLEPAAASPDTSIAGLRVSLARAVRDELELRKRRLGILTYDDLLTRLAGVLRGPRGEEVARRLRERHRVVLVDEFQDTDPVQWEIVERAFGTGGGALVLIGDPKQAIYAFRGADVYAYLAAAATAGTQATLRTNWRSDQGLIDAYDALFGAAQLGHPGIAYREVHAAPANRVPRLTGTPERAALRLRMVPRDAPTVSRTRTGAWVTAPSAREHVAQDLAAEAVRLLDSGAEVELRDDGGRSLKWERIAPGHLAVLVRTNKTAARVRDALAAAGVPAVISGAGSVFGTVSARDWLRLLEALERPASAPRTRSAALTPFLGWDATRAASAGEAEWEAVHGRLHRWAGELRARGVAALTETITLGEGLPARMLAVSGGERRLTDLRHVAQLLHEAATTGHLGVTALTAWLRRGIAEAAKDSADEERSRRLESDAEAVQVLTIHRAKGLEFPVVLLPDLYEPGPEARDPVPVAFHDPDAGDERVLDVGLEGPDWRRHEAQHKIERRGEELRLAYVALTRARHQAVVWWAGTRDSAEGPLTRLLFSRAPDGSVAAAGSGTPSDAAAWARFETLAAEAPGCVAVERSVLGRPAHWSSALRSGEELSAAAFARELDGRWRRTSYSDLTAGAYEARVGSEPEEPEGPEVDDEPTGVPVVADAAEPGLRSVPSLLDGMPAGTRLGTFVHRVLEAADFAAPDLGAELAGQVRAAQARRAVEIGDPAAAVAGLRAGLETPLGPLLGGRRLADVPRADRLDELTFELPLAGGDAPTGRRLELDAVAALLRAHLPAGDPLAPYADRLADAALRRSVRGYLTGSLDLVVRIDGTYAVVDYKTNRLGTADAPLSAWDYRPGALAAEMRHAHYGLQALLYSVALHRYLRWRLAGYDPSQHLAGVAYLFLRGMTGPDTPVVDGVPCGVFAWRPPAALVEGLSDLLDAGAGS